jgi:hypothetical protein
MLCLGIAPVLAAAPPYVAASSPVAKSISLAPFIHVTNSTVTTLEDGIGYVDSVVTINNSILNGTYTNTTEINTAPTNRMLYSINIYGSSQITIENSPALNNVFINTYDSSVLNITNSSIDAIYVYNNSRVYLSDSQLGEIDLNDSGYLNANNCTITLIYLYDSSYLNANNCTIDLGILAGFSTMQITNNSDASWITAEDFSTGQVTDNCTIGTLQSFDAANITVDNSTITTVSDGLVCTGGTLTINGNIATGLSNCRNTLTLTTNGTYPTPTLGSVCALASSNVNITNNDSITNIYARDNSNVNLENDTGVTSVTCTDYSITTFQNSQIIVNSYSESTISCSKHSSLSLQNLNANCSYSSLVEVSLADQSSATINNITLSLNGSSPSIFAMDQSSLDLENINVTGSGDFSTFGGGSSLVNVVNVTATSPATTSFQDFDFSVMTIKSSNITNVFYAVKSNGAITVISGVLGGSYINLTTWDTVPTIPPILNCIAVVGTDTATITNTNLSSSTVELYNSANLNTLNSTVYIVNMYDSSTASSSNSSLDYIEMYDQGSVSLSNITAYNIYVQDSATLICTGNASAPSTLEFVDAESNLPQMVNVVIDNCTVTGVIYGFSWILQPQAAGVNFNPLLLLLYSFSSQGQGFTFTLLVAGVAIFVVVAVVGVVLLRRRA